MASAEKHQEEEHYHLYAFTNEEGADITAFVPISIPVDDFATVKKLTNPRRLTHHSRTLEEVQSLNTDLKGYVRDELAVARYHLGNTITE